MNQGPLIVHKNQNTKGEKKINETNIYKLNEWTAAEILECLHESVGWKAIFVVKNREF